MLKQYYRHNSDGARTVKTNLASFQEQCRELEQEHPQGVFTSFRTFPRDGHHYVWGLDQHLSRLIGDSKKLSSSSKVFSKEFIRDSLSECISDFSASLPQTPIRVRLVTHSSSPLELQLEEYVEPWGADTSITAITVNASRVLPEIKHLNTSVSFAARAQAKKRGSEEALLVGHENLILEGAWSNLFWFDADGKLNTVKDSILPGVTREVVSNLIPCRFVSIELDQFISVAKEVVITQSTTGITSVGSINGNSLGSGVHSANLKGRFEEYIEVHSEVVA